MAKKAFYNKPFDKATKTKIEIFSAYLNEALPVFIHQKYWEEIFIYDLFAGKGFDEQGEQGTALKILSGVSQHCNSIIENKKKLYIIFNDKEYKDALSQNVNEFLINCKMNCDNKDCILDDKHLIIKDNDFREYFNEKIFPNLKKKKNAMKLIFLDPFNFIMDSNLFGKLTSLPQTDFMCFIPTTYLRRLPNEPAFKRFIDDYQLTFSQTNYKHSHRIIAQYIRKLVPDVKDYYIGHFSIEKPQKSGFGKNYYGLIFGSNSILAAEKFQRVCWKIDRISGEADYDIDNEPSYGGNQDLFNLPPLKIEKLGTELKNMIISQQIKTDIEAYKFTVKNCCLPKHAAAILKQMMKDKIISEFKTHNSDIHRFINNPISIEIL